VSVFGAWNVVASPTINFVITGNVKPAREVTPIDFEA
jgi:hypothetical protein